jgi:TolB-like protein
MKKKAVFLWVLVAVAFAVHAETVKPRVGVLDFSANNISQSDARTVGELFTSELVLSNIYDVVDRKNIEALMAEMEFQLSGCTDSSCAVQIGQILSLDYMMYGSINKLGETYIINVNMINVATAQIVGSSRERFDTIEQSYDVMPIIIGKLTQGEDYEGPEVSRLPKREAPEPEQPVRETVPAERFVEIGTGYIAGENESGIEVDAAYRHMFSPSFGLAGGFLLGYGFGSDVYLNSDPGVRFGLTIRVYFQLNDPLGISIGFRGFPEYIDAFGGPAIGVYFDQLYAKVGFSVLGGGGVGVDLGYSVRL